VKTPRQTSDVRSRQADRLTARPGAARAVRGRGAICLLTAGVVALVAGHLAAQVYDRPLTEQDVERVAPLLRAEKAGAARLARQAGDRDALAGVRAKARQEAVGAIAAGGDPHEWLKKAMPAAAAPSTARYDVECSRALTQSAGVPSAVFSFGIAAPSAWLSVWKARDEEVPIGDRVPTTNPPGTQRPGATRPEAVTQQARAFYSSREFEYQGEAAPFEWQFLGPDRTIGATVAGVNVLGRLPACRDLSSGPMVVLKAEDDAFGKSSKPTAPVTNRELAAALDTAGLAEAEYLNLKAQLMTAQADALDPSRLNPQAASEAQRKDLEIRRRNAELYRLHSTVIAPLLAGLPPA
jgi:hypothetical protein